MWTFLHWWRGEPYIIESQGPGVGQSGKIHPLYGDDAGITWVQHTSPDNTGAVPESSQHSQE